MVASDGRLARECLGALNDAGVLATVMKSRQELAAASFASDVDLIVDRPARDAMRVLARGMPDLRFLVLSHYDVGGWSLFATDPSAARPLQLDMLCDPDGQGRLGLRTGDLLPRSGVQDESWLDAPSRAFYYLLKGAWKCQPDRVAASQGALQSLSEEALRTLVSRLIAPRLTAPALQLAQGGSSASLPRRTTLRQIVRLGERILHPAGPRIVLAPGGQMTAQDVQDRMAPLFRGVHVASEPLAGVKSRVLALLPELVLTVDKWDADAGPGGDVDELAAAIAATLDRRLRRQLLGGPA